MFTRQHKFRPLSPKSLTTPVPPPTTPSHIFSQFVPARQISTGNQTSSVPNQIQANTGWFSSTAQQQPPRPQSQPQTRFVAHGVFDSAKGMMARPRGRLAAMGFLGAMGGLTSLAHQHCDEVNSGSFNTGSHLVNHPPTAAQPVMGQSIQQQPIVTQSTPTTTSTIDSFRDMTTSLTNDLIGSITTTAEAMGFNMDYQSSSSSPHPTTSLSLSMALYTPRQPQQQQQPTTTHSPTFESSFNLNSITNHLSNSFPASTQTILASSLTDLIKRDSEMQKKNEAKHREWFHDPNDPYIDFSKDHEFGAQTANLFPERPPYETYDQIRYASHRLGKLPENERHRPYRGQLMNIQSAVGKVWGPIYEGRDSTTFKKEPIQWDFTDPGWRSAMWLMDKATPRYKFEHKNVSIELQASYVQYGMQVPPPLWIDGRIFPTLDHYMSSEGFYNLTQKDKFSPLAPWSLFGAWAAVFMRYRTTSPPDRDWYMRHVTLSYDNRWKPWTYVTSAYAHFTFPHLFMNSMALFAVSKTLGVISPWAMWGMFTTLAIGSSFASLLFTVTATRILLFSGIIRPNLLTPALGASGGLAGMLAFSALSNPAHTVPLFFLPMKTTFIDLLGLLMAIDTIGFIAQCFGKSTGLSHAGHLGGYLSGISMFRVLTKKYDKKYPEGSHDLYINWAENIMWQKKRLDVRIPTHDTQDTLPKYYSKMNSITL